MDNNFITVIEVATLIYREVGQLIHDTHWNFLLQPRHYMAEILPLRRKTLSNQSKPTTTTRHIITNYNFNFINICDLLVRLPSSAWNYRIRMDCDLSELITLVYHCYLRRCKWILIIVNTGKLESGRCPWWMREKKVANL